MIFPGFYFYGFSGLSSLTNFRDNMSFNLYHEEFSLLSSETQLTFFYPINNVISSSAGEAVVFAGVDALLPYFKTPQISSGKFEDFSYDASLGFDLGGGYFLKRGAIDAYVALGLGANMFSGSFSPKFSAEVSFSYSLKNFSPCIRIAYYETAPLFEVYAVREPFAVGFYLNYPYTYRFEPGLLGGYSFRVSEYTLNAAFYAGFSPFSISLAGELEKDKFYAVLGIKASASEVFPFSLRLGAGFRF